MTYSGKDISPSLSVSKSIKKEDGAQCNSPGTRSPLKYPSLTILDSDGGKTVTTARIKSAGVIHISPFVFLDVAKYSKIYKENMENKSSLKHTTELYYIIIPYKNSKAKPNIE